MRHIKAITGWYEKESLARDFLSASVLGAAMLAAAAVLVR